MQINIYLLTGVTRNVNIQNPDALVIGRFIAGLDHIQEFCFSKSAASLVFLFEFQYKLLETDQIRKLT